MEIFIIPFKIFSFFSVRAFNLCTILHKNVIFLVCFPMRFISGIMYAQRRTQDATHKGCEICLQN